LSEADVACSRAVLRDYGNMSSPTVLFVLDEMLRTRPPRAGETAVMASFGAGFSAYAALLEWI
jgi:alkylresorcinol/alkylpyrone synthase